MTTHDHFESQYLNLIRKIKENGSVQYNERTGKNCYFYHGDCLRFDLSDGYFPLLTTKKMAVKSMIGELLGFIRGYDNAADFRKLNCKFWDANANESKDWLENPNRKGKDDLGRIYGVQARNRQTFFIMKTKVFNKPTEQKIPLPYFENREPDYSENNSGMVGNIFESKKCGKYIILKEYKTDTLHMIFDIKFLKTGYIKHNVQHAVVQTGYIKDPYYPTICNIAAYGCPKDKKLAKLLRRTWSNIIHRCYSKKRRMNSVGHKDKGIFVEDRWLLFENFVEDFKKIDRWELKLEYPEKYSLDKDFYCTNMYSAKTCVWASKQEQNINTTQGKQFIAISSEGDEYLECGVSNFSKKHNLNETSVQMALASDCKLKGWQFKPLDTEENCRIRIDDQLAHCISKIKHNPSDRRMTVDHWNPNELHLMALPPCHMNYSFGVRDGKLDMCMYQRSCDVPLGIPMNIASYALLLKIIAQITGLEAGEFIHFLWNVHIYEDQMPDVGKQLEREIYTPPKIEINPNIKSLEDLETWVTPEDFKLIDYKYHEPIKYAFSE